MEIVMNLRHIRAYLTVCSLAVTLLPLQGLAQQNSDVANTSAQHTSSERDGQHDFDFHLGNWKTHILRLQHPLAGSTTWLKYEGTLVVRKVWDGRAQLEELEADGPQVTWKICSCFYTTRSLTSGALMPQPLTTPQ